MTSLERQLKRLAVPHTQATLARDIKRASFLFDPKEAANLDKETIFALGVSGLEELYSIDESFEKYEKHLFDQSTRNWERSMQTKEVNAQLDTMIGKFLIQLSPYFLLKPAHKVLEWLVYRFHVHHFNKEMLLVAFLPYHETKVFVRLLQLLKLNDRTDKWHWMEAASKNGVPVPRTTIINHCKADLGFLSCVCDMVSKFMKVHGTEGNGIRAALSLAACCLLGVVQDGHNINDKSLSIIIPHLTQGLRSRCVDYKALAYMVLSQLVTQTSLKPAIITTLLPILTKKMLISHATEALACLSLVFKTHQVELPKRCFKHIARLPGLISLLGSMSGKYNISQFLRCWLKHLIPYAVAGCSSDTGFMSDSSDELSSTSPDYSTLLLAVINDVTIDGNLEKELVENILKELLKKRQEEDEREGWIQWKNYSQQLLGALERRYSQSFDSAVEILATGDEHNLEHLQELLSLSHSPMKHQIVPDCGTSLFLGLSHANASHRLLAVKHLGHCLSSGKQTGLDDSCCEVLLQRLDEDHIDVVNTVLHMGQKLICSVDKLSLAQKLIKLIEKHKDNQKWKAVVQKSFEILVDDAMLPSEPAGIMRLLPHLVVMNADHAQNVSIIMQAAAVKKSTLFTGVCAEWLKQSKFLTGKGEECEALATLNNMLIEHLAKYLRGSSQEEYSQLINHLWDSFDDDNCSALLLLGILYYLLREIKSTADMEKFCPDMVRLAQKVQEKAGKRWQLSDSLLKNPLKKLLPSWTKVLFYGNHLPASAFYCAVDCLIEVLQKNVPPPTTDPWLDISSVYPSTLLSVMDMLLKQSSGENIDVWKTMLSYLVQVVIPNPIYSKTMCSLWIEGSSRHTSPQLIVGSYYLAKHKWERLHPGELSDMLSSPIAVFGSLLASLLSPHKQIRVAALECITTFKKKCDMSEHYQILRKVAKSRHEIKTDPEHVCQTMSVVYVMDKNDSADDKPARDRVNSLNQLLRLVESSQGHPSVFGERILALLALVPHKNVLKHSTDVGVLLLNNSDTSEFDPTETEIMQHILNRYDSSSARDMLTVKQSWTLFLNAIKSDKKGSGDQTVQLMALNRITHKFFVNLGDITLQTQLVSALVDVGISTKSVTVMKLVQVLLKKFKVESVHVAHELTISEDQTSTTLSHKKMRVKKDIQKIDYARVLLILEVLQVRKKIKDTHSVAIMLFNLLEKLQGEQHEETEYSKQLALLCLHSLTSRWTEETKPQEGEKFSVEVLVQCIRGSSSPQTQRQALLVMAVISQLFPEHVLHHVMLIFAFMGSQLLQQDDSHSFHIITTTITTIIPALLKVQEKKNKKQETDKMVHEILRVFVDARHSVPRHRCRMLFRELLTTVGIEAHLASMMILAMESGVRTKDVPHPHTAAQDTLEFEPSHTMDREIEFIVTVSEPFRPIVQVSACTQMLCMMQKLISLPDQGVKKSNTRSKARTSAFDIPPLTLATLTPNQIKLLQYYCSKMVANHLGRKDFITQVTQLHEEAEWDNLRNEFKSLLNETLQYTSLVARQYNLNSQTNFAKFWRALLNQVSSILEKVNHLLPNTMFLELVSDLMSHEMPHLRKRAMELLNKKIQDITIAELNEDQIESLLRVTNRLMEMMKTSRSPSDTDQAHVQQVQLYSVKLLCMLLGPTRPKAFTPLFPIVIDLLSSPDASPRVISSALLCLAELYSSIGAHAIQYISNFMTPLLTAIDKISQTGDVLFLTCALTTLRRLVANLPHFLSPYLLDILNAVCHVACMVKVDDPTKKTQVGIWQKCVIEELATLIVPRVFLPNACDSFKYLLENNQPGLRILMQIVQHHVETISTEDLSSHHNTLLKLFCDALDLRNAKLQVEWSEMEKLESCIQEALLAMVVRLSESSFRPMFYKLYDWACGEDSPEHRHRQLVFFGLCQQLSIRLRSLFNLFVGHTIKMACKILQLNNTKEDVDYYGDGEAARQHSYQIITHILGCLHKCMLYDTEGFVTKDTFTLLLSPMVDQLENFLCGEDEHEEYVEKWVTPCLALLAFACRDDSAWKTLNYQILLKTRHKSSKVRFAALTAIDAVAQKLGEEYMTLLAETIPFLAELMEDESEKVEQKCQAVIVSLEEVLGESLQKYF